MNFLLQTECTLLIGAYNDTGYVLNGTYRLTITVEDYSQYPVTMDTEIYTQHRSLSTIPLQVS